MKKRVSASKVMRVVSILGIMCLLALQWVWWVNAYRAVEMDFMSKAEECLKASTDKALLTKSNSPSDGIEFVQLGHGETFDDFIKLNKSGKFGDSVKVFPKHKPMSTFELIYSLEESLIIMNRPINERDIDKQFCLALKSKLGFIPKHTIKIHRITNLIDSLNKPMFNRISIGNSQDTIYYQMGFKAYTTVVFPSPIRYFLKKGMFIFAISIVLVLLVGSILILQFISMQRDRKFADFIIDYTRMITHDLRTPVSGIQMIFKMFQKNGTSQSGMQEKYLVEGENLTKKILLNLDNILYMAKSEQMELPVHLTEVEIRDFMEKTVEMYRMRDYNPKTVSIETRYEPTDFNCKMDVGLMENVICNLLDNAIKFTPQEALIVIDCSKKGNNIVFSIRDNGMGMSSEDQKRIFELFERGSANKNSQFSGFGIGLHFVERAVKAHGGKVTVQSEVGKGTEFTIRYTS